MINGSRRYMVTILALLLFLGTAGCSGTHAETEPLTGLDISADSLISDFNLMSSNSKKGMQIKPIDKSKWLHEGKIMSDSGEVATIFMLPDTEQGLNAVIVVANTEQQEEFSVAMSMIVTIVAGNNTDHIYQGLSATVKSNDDGVAYSEYIDGGVKYNMTTSSMLAFKISKE